MKTVYVLTEGERGEGSTLIVVTESLALAKSFARDHNRGRSARAGVTTVPKLSWEHNTKRTRWTAWVNRVDFYQINKMEVLSS